VKGGTLLSASPHEGAIVAGFKTYVAGVALALVWSIVDLALFLRGGYAIGHIFLVWTAYGLALFIGLSSLLCSARVRAWVLLLGTGPPAAVGFMLLLFLYPVYVPFPAILFVGAIKAFDDAARSRMPTTS
jgi:hypothetical protein